jgi:hypothetical protein
MPCSPARDVAQPGNGNMPRVPVAARAVVWLARAAWLVVAVAGGEAVGDALAEHARPVQVAGTAAAWAAWALGAFALAVPGVVTLTLARAVVPGSLVVAAVALADHGDPDTGIALVAPAMAASFLVGTAEFGRVYLQASAYGAEARFGLRPPLGYLAACVATWLVVATAAALVVPALAAEAWLLGAICAAVTAGGVTLLPRRWHQLSRRWFVIVPAGLVVHDPVVLAETLMLPRPTVASVTLDDVGAGRHSAADLTGPTPGVGVEVRLAEPTSAVLGPTPARRDGAKLHVSAFVVAPTRPGSVVKGAAAAGYPTA